MPSKPLPIVDTDIFFLKHKTQFDGLYDEKEQCWL